MNRQMHYWRRKPYIHARLTQTEAIAYILQIYYWRRSSLLYWRVLLSVTPETSNCDIYTWTQKVYQYTLISYHIRKSGPDDVTATADM